MWNQLQDTVARKHLREKLFVMFSVIPKAGFGGRFERVVSCKTIDIRCVICMSISLQLVSADNKGQIRKWS